MLLQHLPDPNRSDLAAWLFATQSLHNRPGPEWDTWHRALRKTLVDRQCREGCAAGSWDPAAPDPDALRGGRLLCTALAVLNLEVYYNYLGLIKLEAAIHRSSAVPMPAVR